MKVALAQTAPILQDVKKNFIRHLELIEKAKSSQADLIIFPELSLTGYTLKDLVPETAINPNKSELFAKLKLISKDISIVLGFVEEKERGNFFNAAAYLSKGKILHIHRKVFLPTYGMFEEAKFFSQGKSFSAFQTPFGKTGLLICYDFLNYGADYVLFSQGADIIIVLSAAPGRGMSQGQTYASSHMWELMGETISRFSTTFLIYCNRVGFEDGKSFAGGSFIYNPEGKQISRASYMDEDFLIKEIDLGELNQARKKLFYKRDNKPEVIWRSLDKVIKKNED
ncbi:MAG TPA: nitrilase-related carbon-nitrogen hydrolase [Acidobacteriota bacterium]|nr:nitrilase-related carbon-nitrogen hydrolase [Acidobacteriota bacterium]